MWLYTVNQTLFDEGLIASTCTLSKVRGHALPSLCVADFAVAGTAKDVSYLIDFLPAYLFPNNERPIAQWLVAGKSLGGHATWIALTHGTPTQLRQHLTL